MRRRHASPAAFLLVLLGAASLAPLACKKEEPKPPTTALEDVQKIGDDAVKSANESSGNK